MCGPCGKEGNAWALVAFLEGCDPSDKEGVVTWLREHDLETKHQGNRKKRAQVQSEQDAISVQTVEEMHQSLTGDQREYLKTERLLSDEVIERYKLGSEDGRIAIPIPDQEGSYRDVRLWLRPEKRTKDEPKIRHWKKGYGAKRLFPVDQLQHDQLLLLEGEFDTLAAISSGIPAITLTAGVQTWPDSASQALAGKKIIILMDNDEAGRKGARKRAESLLKQGRSVSIAEWPEDRQEKWDVTDELRDSGLETLNKIFEGAQPFTDDAVVCLADVEPEEVEWLCEPYIPLGKVTLIEGDPGLGKRSFYEGRASLAQRV